MLLAVSQLRFQLVWSFCSSGQEIQPRFVADCRPGPQLLFHLLPPRNLIIVCECEGTLSPTSLVTWPLPGCCVKLRLWFWTFQFALKIADIWGHSATTCDKLHFCVTATHICFHWNKSLFETMVPKNTHFQATIQNIQQHLLAKAVKIFEQLHWIHYLLYILVSANKQIHPLLCILWQESVNSNQRGGL